MALDRYGQGIIPLASAAEAIGAAQAFQKIYQGTPALEKLRRVVVDYSLPAGKTIIPLHAWINKAGAREWIADPAHEDKIKHVGGTFHTMWYETKTKFHIDELEYDKLTYNQIDRLKSELPTQHATEALRQLADLINNGTTVADYPAYIDEASSTKAFFANDHEFGGTTWDNYENSDTITAAGNIDTNLDNLKTAFANFVKAPDFNGIEAGFGNDYSGVMLLHSANLVNVIHTLQNDPAVYRAGTSYHNDLMGVFSSMIVPGLSDDTACLIRRDATTGPIIFAHTDPWTLETWRSYGSPYQNVQLRWRWKLIPAECRAAYLIA